MNRKQFITQHGATCNNWTWSWSFVNHSAREIIFGAWDVNTEGNGTLIFSDRWKINKRTGKRQSAYNQSVEHIGLLENEGYRLKIFKMIQSDKNKRSDGTGPAAIGEFDPILKSARLVRSGGDLYAYEHEAIIVCAEDVVLEEKIGNVEIYIEGAVKSITVNAYERNPEARQKCIDHWGPRCWVCEFDFGKVYGEIGKNYIHVHHLIPLAMRGAQYEVNPIHDLLPVCPNCHAMLHMDEQPSPGEDKLWKVKALQNAMKLQRR